MPSSIKSYGEKLKEMRIRYDYGVTEISLEELKSDLEYIKSHKSRFKEMLKDYEGYDIVLDSYLIGLESEDIDVIENMNRISKTIQPVDNVDALVPIYLKDR